MVIKIFYSRKTQSVYNKDKQLDIVEKDVIESLIKSEVVDRIKC